MRYIISVLTFLLCSLFSFSQYPIWGGVVSIDLDSQTIQYRTANRDTITVELKLKVLVNRFTIERTINTNGRIVFNKLRGNRFIDRIDQENDTENWDQYFSSKDVLTTVIEGSSQMLELEDPTSFVPFRYVITTRYNQKGVPKYFVQLRFKKTNLERIEEFENYKVIFNEKFRPTVGQLLSNLN
ncbi:MAG: hypothetical protein OXC64_05065 [Flavobacteriaceae bacterium]|nr:hypothetical protein [Flavobacteriaceae bacterium]